MKSNIINKFLLIVCGLFIFPIAAVASSKAQEQEVKTIRAERNYIRKGNNLYNEKRYAEAEVEYRKALKENKDSELGMYNLAASLIRQGGSADPKSKDNPLNQATSLLNDLTQISKNKALTAKAFYNLGNIAFNQEQYQQSVDLYKNSLRRNPDDEQARQNLRLAQKKLQEQQNQDQNKDKDKDKQDQNKDQQQQDQNKDQNKDKDKQDQNKNQDQQKPENKNDKQQQQPQGGQDNSEQILNAVQNNEKDTQQKVNALRTKAQENERRRTRNQW